MELPKEFNHSVQGGTRDVDTVYHLTLRAVISGKKVADVDWKGEGDKLAEFLTTNLSSGVFNAMMLGILNRFREFKDNGPAEAREAVRVWYEKMVG